MMFFFQSTNTFDLGIEMSNTLLEVRPKLVLLACLLNTLNSGLRVLTWEGLLNNKLISSYSVGHSLLRFVCNVTVVN